jgi:quinolinate synthase
MPTATASTARLAHDLAPYMSLENDSLTARIQQVRAKMGSRLLILGHHYQRDEVIALSDLRGDSLQLAQLASTHEDCRAIAFCGVHFMAETADILANRPERLAQRSGRRVAVVLPDMGAGCSLADMADIEQVEDCWEQLGEAIDVADVMPITYVNSAASLKAFCGRHGGIVCTSSNARAALQWAFAHRSRVLFFPDQHLGRNTARAMGVPLEQMPVWDQRQDRLGGNAPEAIRNSRVILWRGHCSVHQMFLPQHVAQFRQQYHRGNSAAVCQYNRRLH